MSILHLLRRAYLKSTIRLIENEIQRLHEVGQQVPRQIAAQQKHLWRAEEELREHELGRAPVVSRLRERS